MAIKNGIKPGVLHMKTVDIEHGGSDIYRRSDTIARLLEGGCKFQLVGASWVQNINPGANLVC